MIIMKNYLQSSIPDSLEESAFLDGATDFQVLFKIVLPLSKPILATLSLLFRINLILFEKGYNLFFKYFV
jgi:putative aldouronate transport system permease protein